MHGIYFCVPISNGGFDLFHINFCFFNIISNVESVFQKMNVCKIHYAVKHNIWTVSTLVFVMLLFCQYQRDGNSLNI